MEIDEELHQQALAFQRNEITEHHIYRRLAGAIKPGENRRILEKIAEDELRHYREWERYSGQDVPPNWLRVWVYYPMGRLLGFTFAIKLMERGEKDASESYAKLKGRLDGLDDLIRDENEHEEALIGLLDEERLRYAGSIVLGMNDALVELTGALAGLTLALQDTKLIALSGLITGIAAAVLIIAFFNYYISVTRDEPFRKRFLEMAGLSLGVAAFSFVIGYVIRTLLGVEV